MKIGSKIVFSPGVPRHEDHNVDNLLVRFINEKIPIFSGEVPFTITAVKEVVRCCFFKSQCPMEDSVLARVRLNYEGHGGKPIKHSIFSEIEEQRGLYEVMIINAYGGKSSVSVSKIKEEEIFRDGGSEEYVVKFA